jgi:adenine-specific DNA-methyltransferase
MAELIWDGKYDEHGNKRAPVRIELPFQTVETVNESAQDRQRTLELSSSGHDPEWRNRLIWGDKKYVLPSLLPEFAGKVDLIYIDPPFSSGQDFSFSTTLPETDDEFTKRPSTLEQKAYRDTWGVDEVDRDRGVTELDRYLRWLNETFVLLRELLSNEGSIFVHLDVHMGPYVKALMDEVFGRDNFLNEVVWYYYNKLHDSRKRALPKAFDQILYYVKDRNSSYPYTALKEPIPKSRAKRI